MKKLLVGIHDKFCSVRAVEYLAKHYSGSRDIEVTLVNVFPNLPPAFWDDGHILTPEEGQARQRVIDIWAGKQRGYIEPILQSAVDDLMRAGFPRENVHTGFIIGTSDVADSLMDEARRRGCQTILIGRCGLAEGKHYLAGSKVGKLINNAAGLAVWIVQ